MQLSDKLLSAKVADTIVFGPCTPIEKPLNLTIKSSLDSEVSYCTLNGTYYKSDYGIVVRMNEDNNPVVGVITRFIKISISSLIVVCKECLN